MALIFQPNLNLNYTHYRYAWAHEILLLLPKPSHYITFSQFEHTRTYSLWFLLYLFVFCFFIGNTHFHISADSTQSSKVPYSSQDTILSYFFFSLQTLILLASAMEMAMAIQHKAHLGNTTHPNGLFLLNTWIIQEIEKGAKH